MILQEQQIFGHDVITVVTDSEIIHFFEKDGSWWSTYSLEELYKGIHGTTSPYYVGQYEDVCQWINHRSVFGEVINL